jgi:hypothetical protein
VSYILQSDHPEALQDGRVVEPGSRISDADAKKNPNLIERGLLEKEPERHKPQKTKSAADEAGQESAAAPQEKEDSK